MSAAASTSKTPTKQAQPTLQRAQLRGTPTPNLSKEWQRAHRAGSKRKESAAALFGSRQSCTDGDTNTNGRKPRWQASKVDRDHTRTFQKRSSVEEGESRRLRQDHCRLDSESVDSALSQKRHTEQTKGRAVDGSSFHFETPTKQAQPTLQRAQLRGTPTPQLPKE